MSSVIDRSRAAAARCRRQPGTGTAVGCDGPGQLDERRRVPRGLRKHLAAGTPRGGTGCASSSRPAAAAVSGGSEHRATPGRIRARHYCAPGEQHRDRLGVQAVRGEGERPQESRSSHCASSTTTSSGARRETSVSRASRPIPAGNRSESASVAPSPSRSRALAWRPAKLETMSSTGRISSRSPLNEMSGSAFVPVDRQYPPSGRAGPAHRVREQDALPDSRLAKHDERPGLVRCLSGERPQAARLRIPADKERECRADPGLSHLLSYLSLRLWQGMAAETIRTMTTFGSADLSGEPSGCPRIGSWFTMQTAREHSLSAARTSLPGSADSPTAAVCRRGAHCPWRPRSGEDRAVRRRDGTGQRDGHEGAADYRQRIGNLARVRRPHQLLRPVMTAVARLPGRQRRSLELALGLAPAADDPPDDPPDDEPTTGAGLAADPLLPGAALLEVLADLAKRSPVLVVVDDAQWIDPSSLEALAFAARRLEAEPVVMLVAARDTQVPAGFERRHAELRLPPLSNREANQLLDALPAPPRGRARGHVLAQAEGNPLALIELARAVAADPGAARYGTAEPIPLADRLTASMVGRLAELPHPAREALLIAAAADNPDLPGVPVEALAPAISLGLVTADGAGARFAHPLVRTAVYHTAPFASRAAAHRRLAEALTGHPDRQAWHLAAATLDTDEHVAQMLEDTAADAHRRGGPAAAVAALERAAELSPEPRERGRRLAAAALAAMQTGQVGWIQELADRAAAAVSDPELLLDAREAVLWGLAWSGTHEAAMAALLPHASEGDDWGDLRWTMLTSAATVAYTSGVPREVAAVKNALAAQADRGQIPADAVRRAEIDANWLWVRAATGPFRDTAELMTTLDALSRMPDQREHPLSWSAPSAWLTDRTELSIELHERLMRRLDALKIGPRGGPLLSLGWSYVDAGRWDQALAVAAEGADLGVAYKMPVVTLTCDLITGIVHAMRGNAAEARRHVGYALAGDPEQNRAIEARARHALGLAAMGEGDYAAAFGQLRGLFTADGQPLHFHLSYLALADLAAAAARPARGPGRNVSASCRPGSATSTARPPRESPS